ADEAAAFIDPADPHSPWARADAWRIGHHGKRIVALELGEQRFEIEARGHAGQYRLHLGDDGCEVEAARLDDGVLNARFDGKARRLPLRADARRVLLHDADGMRWRFERGVAYAWESGDTAGGNQVVAPMPGRIVLVKAGTGDSVE